MRPWIKEDWTFVLTVEKAGPCRLGLEAGDIFRFAYGCPGDFCPKTIAALHTLCEVARSGGDYTRLGSRSSDEIQFCCADGVVHFRLKDRQKEETACLGMRRS